MPSRDFILLTGPEGTFYAHMLRSFAAGFLAAGISAVWANDFVDDAELLAFVQLRKPRAVLRINAILPDRADWPNDVLHAAWIQDYRFNGRDITNAVGMGDWLYFLIHPSIFDIEPPADRAWSILSPGGREDVSLPAQSAFVRDFSLLGFIPSPLLGESPVAKTSDGRTILLEEFLQHYPQQALRQSSFSLGNIRAAVSDTCRQLDCRILSDKVMQTFDELLPRTLERKAVVESLLSVSRSFDIFGPPNWRDWPVFADHHRGFIEDPTELDTVYQTTRINIHNSALSMHFRVLDCMAAGAFILINDTPYDFIPGGVRNYFEPGIHFGAYDIDAPAVAARRYLADEPTRLRIAANVRREVLNAHTWRHRALQVAGDLDLSRTGVDAAALTEIRQALQARRRG